MKVGIISDIHGHYDALVAALNVLYSAGVDKVVCAGDLVDGGSDANRVTELMRQERIICVQGNHDRLAAEQADWMRHHKGEPVYMNHRENLEDATLDFVSRLPVKLRFNWEGKRVLITHGSPWSQDVYVFPHTGRMNLIEVADRADADVVIMGHTHEPMAVQVDDVWLLNPGSVGEDRRAGLTCAVLDLPSCSMTLYDVETGAPRPLETLLV